MKLSVQVMAFSLTRLHLLLIITTLTVVSLAYLTFYFVTRLPKPDDSDIAMLAPRTDLSVQVRVLSLPTTVNAVTRFTAQVDKVKDQLATGKTQISLRGIISLKRGDQITVLGDLQQARTNDTFLRSRSIFSQVFAIRIMKGDKILFETHP